ncbi:hypothetical protein [Hymenobacter profundi]|uniref:Uncharacterized protein n=1 Tax=Hymenobacter profundi TaxID=1982110 RepID=A0ABS6WU65_9BACT|nr:hypothetical protein [Hymenobacter profundi]MBW3127120.1 hypothetical protein [Hymenobacter profundi]
MRLLPAGGVAGCFLPRTAAGYRICGPNGQGLAVQVETRIQQQQQMGQQSLHGGGAPAQGCAHVERPKEGQ